MQVANLSSRDQRELKKGRCPWCGERIVDGSLVNSEAKGDICYECGYEFYGPLTIND